MIDNTTRKIIEKNISDLNDELESLKKYKSLFESSPQYLNTQLRYTEEDKIIPSLKKFVNIYHSKLVTSTEIQELGAWVLDDKSFFDSFDVNEVLKRSLALCDILIVKTFGVICEKNRLLKNTSNEDTPEEKLSDRKQIRAYLKEENIDWVDYWFSDKRKRTSEEISALENEIKAELLKKAELYLTRTPEEKLNTQELADKYWEEEYNLFDWQREERKEVYHESNISLLFTEVFNELLEHSELLIKSSDEKAEVRGKCNTQFFDRLKDQVSDKLDGVPALSIPYDNIEGMKKLVRDILLDIEPRLKPDTLATKPNSDLIKPIKTEESITIETTSDGNEFLKAKVFKLLGESVNKTRILERLPKKELKQNKKWKLSTEQVYIKYFGRDFKKQKETIIRYIKKFRSENTKLI